MERIIQQFFRRPVSVANLIGLEARHADLPAWSDEIQPYQIYVAKPGDSFFELDPL